MLKDFVFLITNVILKNIIRPSSSQESFFIGCKSWIEFETNQQDEHLIKQNAVVGFTKNSKLGK